MPEWTRIDTPGNLGGDGGALVLLQPRREIIAGDLDIRREVQANRPGVIIAQGRDDVPVLFVGHGDEALVLGKFIEERADLTPHVLDELEQRRCCSSSSRTCGVRSARSSMNLPRTRASSPWPTNSTGTSSRPCATMTPGRFACTSRRISRSPAIISHRGCRRTSAPPSPPRFPGVSILVHSGIEQPEGPAEQRQGYSQQDRRQ